MTILKINKTQHSPNLNNTQHILKNLIQTKGIGFVLGQKICTQFGYSYNLTKNKIKPDAQLLILRYLEQNYTINQNLEQNIQNNIRQLVEKSTYRGIRHTSSLPVRGQRTHTNGKTAKKQYRGPIITRHKKQ